MNHGDHCMSCMEKSRVQAGIPGPITTIKGTILGYYQEFSLNDTVGIIAFVHSGSFFNPGISGLKS